jgi:hypothetical protein
LFSSRHVASPLLTAKTSSFFVFFKKVFSSLSFYYVCVCVGWFIDNDLSSHFSLQRGNNHNKITEKYFTQPNKNLKNKNKNKNRSSIYYRNLSPILSSPSGPPFSFLYKIQFQF